MSPRAWLRAGVVLLVLAGAVTLYALLAPRLLPLPVYMTVPDVTLIDETGQPFALNATRGKVVVLAPVYTHCPDVCPLTLSKLQALQQRLRRTGLDGEVRLVAFTVDPERDDVAVLHRLANSLDADPKIWKFLTGSNEAVGRLVSGMGIYVGRARVDGTALPESAVAGLVAAGKPYLVNHTDRLFLADRQGRVRALSPGSGADVDQVMSTLRRIIAGS